jgi:hypothetical protein
MNINIMKEVARQSGSSELMDMVNRAEAGGCPMCGDAITTDEFSTWDALTQKEFRISGMCKTCQDKFFGEDE